MTWRLVGSPASRPAALRTAGVAGAVLTGLAVGWAACGARGLAGLGVAAGPDSGARLVGALAVLLAAANGYSKAYSP